MKFDKYRQDWNKRSKQVTGPAFPSWPTIQQIVIHYPGADWQSMDFDKNGTLDYRDTAQLLDTTNNYYWTSRGYAIGYNAAADTFGVTWELRGDTYKCAANVNHNETSFAILVIVDGASGASTAQIEAVRRLVGQARTLSGKPLPLVAHGDLAGAATACPGGGIRAQLKAGLFEPVVDYPKPTLKYGSRSSEVVKLKDHLGFWKFFSGLNRTPIFGTGTKNAVKRFQRQVGIQETGVWDIKTYDAYIKFTKSF